MPLKLDPLQQRDLVNGYLAGETGYELGGRFKVGKSTVYRVLEAHAVPLRHEACHIARQDSRAGRDELLGRAASREANATQCSPGEVRLIEMLRDRGAVDIVSQKAIGPYNVDVFIRPLAVELWGGGWHGSGAHLERYKRRTTEILSAGWWQVSVWSHTNIPLVESGADEVIALLEFCRSNPTAQRQHWVVWGNGQHVRASTRLHPNDRPLIPPH